MSMDCMHDPMEPMCVFNNNRVFDYRNDRLICHAFSDIFSKTVQLKAENLAQTTFMFTPIEYRAPRCSF